MKYIALFVIMLTSAVCLHANNTKSEADTLYNQHHYEQAEKIYAELLKANPQNSELLYNLGNCHYRLKNVGKAILYYERAAKINPSDADIRHNLAMARALTTDKLYSSDDLEIVYSFNSFINTLGSDGWGWVSICALAVLLAMVLVMRFSNKPWVKKLSFVVLLLMLLLIIVSSIFAYIQRSKYEDHSSAIIMQTSKLMSTPDTTGAVVTTLHEGTKASLRDTTIPAWTEISLSDGHKGWIATKDIENI